MIAELSMATARYEDVKKRSERLGDESRYLGAVLKPVGPYGASVPRHLHALAAWLFGIKHAAVGVRHQPTALTACDEHAPPKLCMLGQLQCLFSLQAKTTRARSGTSSCNTAYFADFPRPAYST